MKKIVVFLAIVFVIWVQWLGGEAYVEKVLTYFLRNHFLTDAQAIGYTLATFSFFGITIIGAALCWSYFRNRKKHKRIRQSRTEVGSLFRKR